MTLDDYCVDLSGAAPQLVRRARARVAWYAGFALLTTGVVAFGSTGTSWRTRAVASVLQLGLAFVVLRLIDNRLFARTGVRLQIEVMASGRTVVDLRNSGRTSAVVRSMHWTLTRDGNTEHCRTLQALYAALGAPWPFPWDEGDTWSTVDPGERSTLLDTPASPLADVSHLIVHIEFDTPYDNRYSLDAHLPAAAFSARTGAA